MFKSVAKSGRSSRMANNAYSNSFDQGKKRTIYSFWLNFEVDFKCLTGQDGFSFALFLHVSMFFSRKSEGRLKDKATDVVMVLEVGLLLQLLLFIEIRHYIGHLNVGKSGVQVFRIHL